MALNSQPNALESAFFQRNSTNAYYEQINISGSDLIIYHDSTGKITADKVGVWASYYGIGSGGSGVVSGGSYNISASWASSSLSASYINGGLSTTVSYIKSIKWNGVITGSMVFINGILTEVT